MGAHRIATTIDDNDEKVNVIGYGVEAMFNILPDGALVPFVAVGVGGIHYSRIQYDDVNDENIEINSQETTAPG